MTIQIGKIDRRKIFRVVLPDGRALNVKHYTAGEARAAAKQHFGIPRKDRLPIGTKTIRTEQ